MALLSDGETDESGKGDDCGEELHVVYVFGIGGEWSFAVWEGECCRSRTLGTPLIYLDKYPFQRCAGYAPSYQCILIEVETLSVCSLGSVMETITHVSLPIWSDESAWWQINPERDLGSLYANGQ